MRRILSKFKCNCLDWHKPCEQVEWLGFDNYSSKCKYCGRPILWSSGGWFSTCEKQDNNN